MAECKLFSKESLVILLRNKFKMNEKSFQIALICSLTLHLSVLWISPPLSRVREAKVDQKPILIRIVREEPLTQKEERPDAKMIKAEKAKEAVEQEIQEHQMIQHEIRPIATTMQSISYEERQSPEVSSVPIIQKGIIQRYEEETPLTVKQKEPPIKKETNPTSDSAGMIVVEKTKEPVVQEAQEHPMIQHGVLQISPTMQPIAYEERQLPEVEPLIQKEAHPDAKMIKAEKTKETVMQEVQDHQLIEHKPHKTASTVKPTGYGVRQPSEVSSVPIIQKGIIQRHQEETLLTVKQKEPPIKREINPTNDPKLIAYLDEIRRRIEKAKMYPHPARMMGIEGAVTLEIALLPDGNLHEIRIMHPSEYEILNKAAIETVQTAFPLKPETVWEGTLRVELPIMFRLKGGER